MFKNTFVIVWSENPDKLMKFYRDVLELEFVEKVDIPNDYGYEFKLTPEVGFWVGKHSEVKGYSKEPVRIMHNLYTDNVKKWYEKVKAAGCKILSKPVETPFSKPEKRVWVSTFLDPEGNCWQFMGKLK